MVRGQFPTKHPPRRGMTSAQARMANDSGRMGWVFEDLLLASPGLLRDSPLKEDTQQAEEEGFQEILTILATFIEAHRGIPYDQAEDALLGQAVSLEELKLAFYHYAVRHGDSIDSAQGAPSASGADPSASTFPPIYTASSRAFFSTLPDPAPSDRPVTEAALRESARLFFAGLRRHRELSQERRTLPGHERQISQFIRELADQEYLATERSAGESQAGPSSSSSAPRAETSASRIAGTEALTTAPCADPVSEPTLSHAESGKSVKRERTASPRGEDTEDASREAIARGKRRAL